MHSVFPGDQIANPADFPVNITAVNLRPKSHGRVRSDGDFVLFNCDDVVWQLPFAFRQLPPECEGCDRTVLQAVYGYTYEPVSMLSEEVDLFETSLLLSIGATQ